MRSLGNVVTWTADALYNIANALDTRAARWGGWTCTRRTEHTGRHAAGMGQVIVAVWE